MRILTNAILIVGLAASATAARAQDTDDGEKHGLNFSLGVGATTSGLSCQPKCNAPRQSGPAFKLWVAGHVSPQFSLGFEATQYATTVPQYKPQGKWDFTWISFTGQWYPSDEDDFFFKAGVGLAAIKADVQFGTSGILAISTTDFGGQFGIGRDFRLTDRYAVTVFADYLLTPHSQAVVDGTNSGARAAADLIQIGLSFSRP